MSRWGALYKNSWVSIVKLNSLKELVSEYVSHSGAQKLLACLNDRKTVLELIAVALIGKGFKMFWPKLTKVQTKSEFIEALLEFKVGLLEEKNVIVVHTEV